MKFILSQCFILLIYTVPYTAAFGGDKIVMSVQQIANLEIEAAKPAAAESLPLISAPATVVIPSVHEYFVSAPQSGRIANIKLAVGEAVSKDQIMALLDSPNLLSLQRDYLNDRGELTLAKASLIRETTLYKGGVISKRKWLVTKNDYDRHYRAVKGAHRLL